MKLSTIGTSFFSKARAATLGLILASFLAACSSGATALPATDTALATEVPQPSSTPAPTNTLEPTSTPTPLPTASPTRTPTNTPTPDLLATEIAAYLQEAAELVDSKIAPELEKLGYSTGEGELVWYYPQPEDLRVFDYRSATIFQLGEDLNVDDFILYTEVTWESTHGFATCGIVYRAEPEITDGEYYFFQTMRMSGLPAWDIEFWDHNQFITVVSGGVQTNHAIKLDQGSTNAYMLVVQGDKMTAYANGTRLRTQYDKRRAEGLLAFTAWQDSGETTCTFSNTWVWALK